MNTFSKFIFKIIILSSTSLYAQPKVEPIPFNKQQISEGLMKQIDHEASLKKIHKGPQVASFGIAWPKNVLISADEKDKKIYDIDIVAEEYDGSKITCKVGIFVESTNDSKEYRVILKDLSAENTVMASDASFDCLRVAAKNLPALSVEFSQQFISLSEAENDPNTTISEIQNEKENTAPAQDTFQGSVDKVNSIFKW